MIKKLNIEEIYNTYKMICEYYEKYLKSCGVKMPKLNIKGNYTRDALILIYLAQGYPLTRIISKSELTEFIRIYYPSTNDVQQARHLGAQKGWFIAAGGRDNRNIELNRGEYKLLSLEDPYPTFHGHRVKENVDWEKLKAQYGYRCATCGSKENEPHFHYKNTITKLQKSHKDPNKPLVKGNIIPQCQKCNRADRNNWVYDENGRVIRVANPIVIKRSDMRVKKEAYEILYREFGGRNPFYEK